MTNATLKNFIKGRELSATPLQGEPFKVGDIVTFTNEQGVKFNGLKIFAFGEHIYPNSGTIYLEKDAYWFPVKAQSLTLEKRD